jgi:ribosomal protein S18 acetylase RimI-like enzyme
VVVGFLVYRPAEAGEGEILNLGVDPAARRHGIARALIERACGDTGPPVYLEVRASNYGAIAFYRRLGFEEAGRRVRYYSRPAEDAIVMRRAPEAGEESGEKSGTVTSGGGDPR